MKILRITCLLLPLLFPAAWADSNTVASANILGYTKITIPSNQLVLVSTSFLSESNTVASLFSALPVGTKISIWNTSEQKYYAVFKLRSGWGTGGTNEIRRGSGVFITLPVNTQTNILLSGTVPMDETSTVYKVNGLALLSYPYPSGIAFTNTALAKGSMTGDRLSIWSNGWTSYIKLRSGWPSAITNLNLQVGQAFFYLSTTNKGLDEIKPYTIN